MAYTRSGYCVGALGTMTLALKATRALASHGIFAEVIGLSASETKRGCAFGISFDCSVIDQVRRILKSHDISVSQYLQKREVP